MATENLTPITIEAAINAPVEKVWEYWNNPEHIKNWAFASPEWHAPNAANDLRVGGNFSTTMAARDGSMSFEFGGTYTTVEEHKLIQYVLADGRQVKIVFEADGEQTRIAETFDPETTNPLEMQRGGWQAILDNFKKLAEDN
ncbi:SRPBCC family protein [Pedobacter sp. Leaf194]|uniref:SRPBCC family protein n=1 Tax=Pedobacter sp. Leaf194 TaxID=1736297 RepID=UPI000702FF5A|nr:SRPBCC family protein [Pedobacter sp. Leaf194]KQS36745.1 polyketide cyclase [Pedobacter sp. Leaf194]